MELTDRLLTLRPEDQLKVMERVFQKLSLAFGNQMLAKWQGLDMQAVYRDWAEGLQDKSLGAINFAILKAKECEHPPSQGSFVEFCRLYLPPANNLQIEKKYQPVPQEVGLERLAELKRMLAESVAKMTEPA